MLTAVIVHGYHGRPFKRDWMVWLGKELKSRGLNVSIRQYPAPENPKLSRWLTVLNKEVSKAPDGVILIGHSLGSAAILRFLERYRGSKVKAAVMVASGYGYGKHPKLYPFTIEPFDWPAIRRAGKKFVVLHSRDDDVVSFKRAQQLARKLRVPIMATRGYYHFNRKREPVVLKAVEKVL